MAKAGKHIKFLRTGMTIGMHVGIRGEVIPLPNSEEFAPLSAAEQRERYGMIYYELSDDDINVGPQATAKFVPAPEPTGSRMGLPPLGEEAMGPVDSFGRGETTRVVGGVSVSIAGDPTIGGQPDETTLPGTKSAKDILAAERARDQKAVEQQGEKKTAKLKRKPFEAKKKKKLEPAEATSMKR